MAHELTEKEACETSYNGNSVRYLFDKMKCYQTQVGFLGKFVRLLGVDTSKASNNQELEKALEAFAETNSRSKDLLAEAIPYLEDLQATNYPDADALGALITEVNRSLG